MIQELMQHMANVQYTENMTEDQLDAMAGAETLRSQFTVFGMSKANKVQVTSLPPSLLCHLHYDDINIGKVAVEDSRGKGVWAWIAKYFRGSSRWCLQTSLRPFGGRTDDSQSHSFNKFYQMYDIVNNIMPSSTMLGLEMGGALSKSTNRLRDSLFPRDGPNQAVPLLLLIAQHRSMVVINADAPHIKMVSEQFDRCHGSLLQYVEFLSSAVTPDAYAQLVPALDDLVHTYHLDSEVAFLIYRPVMRLFRCSGDHETYWPLSIPHDTENHPAEKEPEPSSDVLLDRPSPQTPIKWLDLIGTVRSMLPSRAWNSLSPDLYATFWGLTLYDLYVPRSRYETEIAKQHNNLKALEELSDNSSSAIMKRKKDKEKTQELLDKLIAELQKHEEHVASVSERLAYEKDKWLSSCPDTLKTNMEFLQRCIFPRCVFSMLDAVYCAIFVHTLHSLGTPYFNTVNHIDVLICKTLQPMICCCTEYEASRLGRFLYETLKMAYRWKSDESVYERECGNMPGFAVYYRYPNSKRVTFSQFVRVHTKWNTRITRLLIQCLESPEYIEIRNALIMLTKISSIFPVTRKTGLNLERRVSKIKNDEREDLKVLATGVAAALAGRKGSWVSEEEFAMGLTDVKHAASPAKPVPSNLGMLQNGPQSDSIVTKNGAIGTQFPDQSNAVKDQVLRAKISDGMADRSEGVVVSKSDLGQQKMKFSSGNSAEITSSIAVTPAISKPSAGQTAVEEGMRVSAEENNLKIPSKTSADSEARSHAKRSTQSATAKQPKQDLLKDETRSERSTGKGTGQISSAGREGSSQVLEGRQSGSAAPLTAVNGSSISTSLKGPIASTRSSTDTHGSLSRTESGPTRATDMKVSVGNEVDDSDLHEKPRLLASRHGHSPARDDSLTIKPADRQLKKNAPIEEQERLGKRRKGDPESKDGEGIEVQLADRERSFDFRDKSHLSDHEKFGSEEQSLSRLADKLIDKTKDKGAERHEKDHRDKADRPDKMRGEDILDKSRDRSMERYSNERSVERMQDRADRNLDRTLDKARDERGKDDRSKVRHSEPSLDKSHSDDRFHGQSLPPPPPLPPSFVPQSFGGSRRDEEIDRRVSSRHAQRLSPKHDEKERRRSEENPLVSHEDAKRRREEDFRERKRDERDGLPMKAEEREREKGMITKDDAESTAASKRRKLKRDHPSAAEAGEYTPVVPPLPPPLAPGASQRFDGRESGERKGTLAQRAAYVEESTQRMHAKEAASKIIRRDSEQLHEREWEEEKRQRTEAKRKHRK
ncbi:hypothetical protein Taro_017363 [Colocasia esculenta]|uniref:THO complex subunitTHOC2 C-terminal domain-containing protein n=1 Tax=Colocasia esculenta TaxID=4460 RepID=A0A843UVT9_COLES|nr:hypothetical protein [Colocasia esculenta]